jgi:hypothetical protein
MLPGIKFVSKAFTLGLQGMSVAPGTVITTMVLGCAAATASISASWSLIEPIGGDPPFNVRSARSALPASVASQYFLTRTGVT